MLFAHLGKKIPLAGKHAEIFQLPCPVGAEFAIKLEKYWDLNSA